MPHQIYVVEDHPVMRRAYAQLLESEADLDLCGTAESAEEALEALSDGACDLVLTDLALPGMSGTELAARLATDRPDLPVVVLSAYDDEDSERRALRSGARAFVSKREAGTALVPTLRRILSNSAPA